METSARNSLKERIGRIFYVAFPLIVQGLVFQLQSLTDKAFLGNLDTKYVSAVGAAQMPFYTVVDSMGAISIGLVIIISTLYGAGQKDKINAYVKSTALYHMLIGIAFFLLWELFAEPILVFFKTDALIIDYSVTYIRICAIYLLVFGIDSAFQSMLQGIGDTKPIMYSGILKVGLNMLISWVLVFGKLGFPALNIAGAAIGTVVADIIAFLYIAFYCLIVKKKQFHIKIKDRMWFHIKPYGQVIKLGIMSGLEYLLWNASNLLLIRFINGFSYMAMGIYTLTFGFQCIVFIVCERVSKSALTLMGHNIGAKQFKRADQLFYNCIVINLIIVLVSFIGIASFPGALLDIFSNDPELIKDGIPYMIFMGFILFPQSINVICGNGIKAHGNTKWMFVSQAIGSTLIVVISCFLVLVLHMNMIAIYATIFIDETVRGAINYLYYRRKYGYRVQQRKNVDISEIA